MKKIARVIVLIGTTLVVDQILWRTYAYDNRTQDLARGWKVQKRRSRNVVYK